MDEPRADLVYWKIRAFDREKKDFFDRCFWIDLRDLDPRDAAKIELLLGNDIRSDPRILKYRPLFEKHDIGEDKASLLECQSVRGVSLDEYLEDESGQQITSTQIAQLKAGNPNTVAIPQGVDPNDYFLILNAGRFEDRTEAIEAVELPQDELDGLHLFLDDMSQLRETELFKRSPILRRRFDGSYETKTLPLNEIVAFCTIFRRLFMTREPGSYNKACTYFGRRFWNPFYKDLVVGQRRRYEQELNKPVNAVWHLKMLSNKPSCTCRELINAFLYTRIAHQQQEEHREMYRQTQQEAGEAFLFAVGVIFRIFAIHWSNTASIINSEFQKYLSVCDRRRSSFPTLNGINGLGKLRAREQEEREQQQAATFNLAERLWEQNDRVGKPSDYLDEARRELEDI